MDNKKKDTINFLIDKLDLKNHCLDNDPFKFINKLNYKDMQLIKNKIEERKTIMRTKEMEVTIKLPKPLWVILTQIGHKELRSLESQIVWELMKNEYYQGMKNHPSIKHNIKGK